MVIDVDDMLAAMFNQQVPMSERHNQVHLVSRVLQVDVVCSLRGST